jgi:hypothetical protein
MKRGSRDLQVLGVRRWRELVIDRKNGRILFDSPKPTVGCSANGIRRRSLNKYPFKLQCPVSNPVIILS